LNLAIFLLVSNDCMIRKLCQMFFIQIFANGLAQNIETFFILSEVFFRFNFHFDPGILQVCPGPPTPQVVMLRRLVGLKPF